MPQGFEQGMPVVQQFLQETDMTPEELVEIGDMAQRGLKDPSYAAILIQEMIDTELITQEEAAPSERQKILMSLVALGHMAKRMVR